MINGVNTVDFKFAAAESTNAITSNLPKGRSDLISVFQYAYQPDSSITPKGVSNTKEFTLIQTEPNGLERVQVQRLQTHAQLRNNRWNYQTFLNMNGAIGDTIMDETYNKTPNNNYNNKNNNNNNNNIIYSTTNNTTTITTTNNNNNNKIKNFENKSAFIKCNNNKEEENRYVSNIAGTRLEYFMKNQDIKINDSMIMKGIKISNDSDLKTPNMFNRSDKLTSDRYSANAIDGQTEHHIVANCYRTEDQENAFRRIEDVHNYAKLKRYGNSNESSDGSTRDYDDDEEDDDDEDDVEDDDDDNGIEDYEIQKEIRKNNVEKSGIKNNFVNLVNNKDGGAINHRDNFVDKNQNMSKTYSIPSKSKESHSLTTDETDTIIDIETVVGENEHQLVQSPPAHHARRPMNAFLIFCKRHRAIVKDRYKSLENRAITKILGDWWASLDNNEKDCFTKLAQQNKDAFFSAHPNFKWYKLPAPPLRTLNTRPSNAERAFEENEHEKDELKLPYKAQSGSYFKLADETQMGELNALMNMKSKQENQTQCPLQKALGETTHFLSAHMPNIGDSEITDALHEKRNTKRRAITENSFSSNSSEDDVIPRKTSRSCKGKIYQELVSSGQIAPITKKAKTTKIPCTLQYSNEYNNNNNNDASESHDPMIESSDNLNVRMSDMRGRNTTKHSTISESDVTQNFSDQFGQFDLEEKIKKLPALSLDAYLQRKRNTKKKKKFTTKKRNSNSVTLPETELKTIVDSSPSKEVRNHQYSAAVGSQKRKARKESITRRDISAIESEVASLIPLTSNFNANSGQCYYYNEMNTITSTSTSKSSPTSTSTSTLKLATITSPSTLAKCTEIDSVPYSASSDSSRPYCNYVDSTTTTSDLFILAEVAAKRTELTN